MLYLNSLSDKRAAVTSFARTLNVSLNILVHVMIAAFLVACGQAEGAVRKGSNGAGAGGASVGQDQPSNLDPNAALGGASAAPECSGPYCSEDLRELRDCDGTVLKTCPADTGCANGACIEPCEAAKANASARGCEFYSVVPAPYPDSRGSCFAALVANTWSSPISISVEYQGKALDLAGLLRMPVGTGAKTTYEPLPGGQLPPGSMAILFLAGQSKQGESFIQCPAGVTPGITTDPSININDRGSAFRITTSAPIIAYDIFPYGGKLSYISSATLLIPVSAWGTNYVTSDGASFSDAKGESNSFVQVVGIADDTKFAFRANQRIQAGPAVQSAAAGSPKEYTLNKGEALQFSQTKLSGSVIESNTPVGVWGGNPCTNFPLQQGACDSAHQQFAPVKSLGWEYVAVPHRDRVASYPEPAHWTLVGTVDNTPLEYAPQRPLNAPKVINGGEVLEITSRETFSVRSDEQHPFYFAGHMTGSFPIPSSHDADAGDPDFVNVISPRQWLSSYLFLTDPTYGNTHLVFVRQKAKDGQFKDVKLDCLGVVGGWKPVGGGEKYEFAYVDLVTAEVPNGSCSTGAHTAESELPFGLTVWGWDWCVSYAYPAGMSVRPINSVVARPLPK